MGVQKKSQIKQEVFSMRKLLVGVHVLVVGGFAVASAYANCGMCAMHPEKEKAKATSQSGAEIVLQTTCPVMGGKIDKSVYTEHDGKRIYVCCKGCIAKIDEDPAVYIKKLEDAGITLERVQTKCPVMGGEINKNLFVEHDGMKIYVCCPGCIAKIKADPEKYAKKVADELKMDLQTEEE
jgi:YHS domain-containing protein